MSTPSTFFLDTSILAGQQYNFHSTAFTSFVTVARERGMRLLLPDPTRREVVRQIRERSAEALKALETARRKAPFLAKWKHYPNPPQSSMGDWEVKRVADGEWSEFLKQFDVVPLGYDDVRLPVVMDWYDCARAPFGKDGKRKEFPDAFAVAILAAYAAKNNTFIAVVASDDDFKRACTHYSGLFHFPSLPSLTELLLADTEKVDAIKQLLEHFHPMLEEAIVDATDDLSFYHANDRYKEIDEVDSLQFEIEDVRVVGLGPHECTVTFSGVLEYRACLKWQEDDYYYARDFDAAWQSDYVSDAARLSGTAKLQLRQDLSAIEAVSLIELEEDEIKMKEEPW